MKYKPVLRSFMGAEVYVFVDAFEKLFGVPKNLQKVSGVTTPLSFADPKRLFDAVAKG